ncbi:MAG TPA: hybrid sensor histidine kinase/response regulator, partial [Candidatus Dormibacteraeota bacterium]
MWWVTGTIANLVIAIAYLGISVAIVVPLVRERQLRSNPLGSATAAIFLTCAVHHGGHAVKAMLPFVNAWHGLGFDAASGIYTRLAWDPQAVTWDVLSAGVAVYYWSLRRTYAPLMRGAKLFEDLRERQRRALEINDDIVQGLAE